MPLFNRQTPTSLYECMSLQGATAMHGLPEELRGRILVDTVHDGGVLPEPFLSDREGRPLVPLELLERRHIEERDWGANLVARELAAALGLASWCRVHLARVLLDFNRFPGTTPPNTRGPLDRLAINPPFASALDHGQKLALLELYDKISEQMEGQLDGRLVKIEVHTYDEHNASTTKRPDVSLINQPASYQKDARMPFGVFDPLYPDHLAESTCSRVLSHRISLNLERAGYRVGHNHPYLLPEGSMAVRSQVWYFFRYLRTRYEEAFPATRDDPGHAMVWQMLLNTNQRLSESAALRGFLHRYWRVGAGRRPRFEAAQRAYAGVRRFLQESEVVSDYRRSPDRPSSLVIEVRKDLLCEFDATGRPVRARPEVAIKVARVIAEAVVIFFETDRVAGGF